MYDSAMELLPDRRVEATLGGVRDVSRLALAESPHPMSYRELEREVRDRLDFRLYKRAPRQTQEAMRQDYLTGAVECLAFRGDRWRLSTAALRQLESDKPAYREKCTEAAHGLAAAAAEHAAGRRPAAHRARVELDTSFEPGLAVSEVDTRGGLIRYDGSDLLRSERDLLPEGHKAFGTLHLVMRRFELHLATDGHTEELLVFNYPKGDPDRGRRAYQGQATPDMHVEIRRERVPLGILRQQAAELRG